MPDHDPCRELEQLTSNVTTLTALVSKHTHTLYGNGDPGMDEEMRNVKVAIAELTRIVKLMGRGILVIIALVLLVMGERGWQLISKGII